MIRVSLQNREDAINKGKRGWGGAGEASGGG